MNQRRRRSTVPPELYRRFDQAARKVIRSGRSRYSARAILHHIRWDMDMARKKFTWKVNNDYSPVLARLWMANNPHLPALFRLRATKR